MYEMARQRMAEQQRAAREAGEARRQRRIARGRPARAEAPDKTVVPAIPDFAHEMFDPARDAVRETARDEVPAQGRRARTRS
jgi:hypothetical protein